jgi:hypothetical protein
MTTLKILHVVAIAACAGFFGCGASSDDPAEPNGSSPRTANIVPVPNQNLRTDGVVSGSTGTGIPAYNGGPVVNGPISVIPIFYGTAWQPGYQSAILSFLGTLSSTSYWRIVEGYGDAAGHHPGNVSVGTPVNETDYAFGRALTPYDIQQIAQTRGTPYTNDPSSNTIYLVFTADDVNEVNAPGFFQQSGELCTGWLGWHYFSPFTYFSPNTFTTTTFTTEYAFVGSLEYCIKNNLDNAVVSDWESSVDGTIVGEALSAAMHELAESATDPDINAWYPEIGDECAWIPGPLSVQKVACGKGLNNCFRDVLWDEGEGAPYTSNQLGYYVNQGSRHLLQTLWDVKQNGCAYGPAALDSP